MRIYKTRSIAADACKNGRITLNGVQLKPSRTFKVGDTFNVRKGPITYTYRVLQLTENRLGAKLVPEYLRDCTAPKQLELLELELLELELDLELDLDFELDLYFELELDSSKME